MTSAVLKERGKKYVGTLEFARVGEQILAEMEMAALEETSRSLGDRLKDKLSRKKLAYAAYSRRSGK
jgi:hypothetical protein